MKIRLLSHAKEDLREIIQFYDQQETGAGSRAMEALDLEIEALKQTAGQHPLRLNHHRAVLRGAYKALLHLLQVERR